jgi:hypothetical protein
METTKEGSADGGDADGGSEETSDWRQAWPFGSRFASSVFKEIRFLENRNRLVLKILGTDHFDFRLFQFGSGSNRTNQTFSEDLKTTINIRVVRQIYALVY